MSPMNTATTTEGIRFPRVSGDEPGAWGDITAKSEFSPRERG